MILMIYMDNAATSWPKPPEVVESMTECLLKFCANPGRSGHDMALRSENMVYDCREKICELFGDLPRIELFARQYADGWDCWGNEAPGNNLKHETVGDNRV